MGLVTCAVCGVRFEWNDVPGPLPKSEENAPRCLAHTAWNPPEEKLLDGVKPRPSIYPCGCSRIKVAAGRCDHYDENGDERP